MAANASPGKKRKTIKKKKGAIPSWIIPLQPSDKTKDQLDFYSLVYGTPAKIFWRNELLDYITESLSLDLTKHAATIEAAQTDIVGLVRDPMSKYGSTFYFVTKKEEVESLKVKYSINVPPPKVVAAVAEEPIVAAPPPPEEIPPERRWLSYGSETEIPVQIESRPLLKLACKTKLKHISQPCKFEDSEIVMTNFWSDAALKQFWVACHTVDKAIECIEKHSNIEVQTERIKVRNKAAQYEAISLSEEAVGKHLRQPKLRDFLGNALLIIEEILAENALYDTVADDWEWLNSFKDSPGDIGSKGT